MASVKVHLKDGDSYTLIYEEYGPLLDIPGELWSQHGIDISVDEIEVLEPLG